MRDTKKPGRLAFIIVTHDAPNQAGSAQCALALGKRALSL